MSDSVDFHDLTIDSCLVDALSRRLVLKASDRHAPGSPILVAEFSGLEAYAFSGDMLGTVIFEVAERQASALYAQWAGELQRVLREAGGYDAWVCSDEASSAFFDARHVRGFELSSSIGCQGACRSFTSWAEPQESRSEPRCSHPRAAR